jgi:hypothetical protein
MSTLADVTILVTSFLRPGYLFHCLQGIRDNLPECTVITVDDSGDTILDFPSGNGRDLLVRMQFDSGLSAKRNTGVRICHTKYLLLGCDDFDFSTKKARDGIQMFVDMADAFPQFDVFGGRVDDKPYEGFLEYKAGEYIKETRLDWEIIFGQGAICDLTVNYFLGRTEVMKQFPWPEEMKIGGEHVCFFLDLKLAGRKVCWVRGANITTLKLGPEAQHPDYAKYRARAKTLGHPLMLKRYNIKEYIGF